MPNLIVTLVQDKLPEHVAIERKKVKACEGAAGGREDELVHPLVEGNIGNVFFASDVPDDGTVLLNAPVGFGLEGIRRTWIFPNGNQRTKGYSRRGVALQATHNGLHILAVPLRRGLAWKALRESNKA